ncbi:hypothetical protein DFP73DRAFT_532304 [Morchella snyderi]|nr:hypothetical protein DFP73DRAFT_532304 [Morchella snyderi]
MIRMLSTSLFGSFITRYHSIASPHRGYVVYELPRNATSEATNGAHSVLFRRSREEIDGGRNQSPVLHCRLDLQVKLREDAPSCSTVRLRPYQLNNHHDHHEHPGLPSPPGKLTTPTTTMCDSDTVSVKDSHWRRRLVYDEDLLEKLALKRDKSPTIREYECHPRTPESVRITLDTIEAAKETPKWDSGLQCSYQMGSGSPARKHAKREALSVM